MFDSLQPHGLWPARLCCPWDFSRQEYWSGLPFPSLRDLLDPGIKRKSPTCPELQVDSSPAEPSGKPNFSSFELLSYVWFCGHMHCSTPGFSVHHQLRNLLKLMSIKSVMPSNQSHPLLSPSSPAFSLSQHQGLSQWVSSSHQVAKVLPKV